MKIVLVNSVCGYGSTGRIMVDLAKTYMRQGHQCILAYGRGKVSGMLRDCWKKNSRGSAFFTGLAGGLQK